MEGRSSNLGDYRYGFQGQEEDNEINNKYSFKFRLYDPNISRFHSIDPLTSKYPHLSSYCFSGNRVLDAIELEGAEPVTINATEGTTYSGISRKYGVSINQLTSLNSYDPKNIPIGATINLANPSKWHHPEHLEEWINSGAIVAPGDLFTHPANLKGNDQILDIMARISPNKIKVNNENFSNFGLMQFMLKMAKASIDQSQQNDYNRIQNLNSITLKKSSEIRSQLFQAGLFVQGGVFMGGATGFLSRSSFAAMSSKLGASILFQGVIGGFSNVDYFDAGIDMFTMPGFGNYLGAGIDVRPFANDNRIGMIGINKPISTTLYEFGIGYFFDKRLSVLDNSIKSKTTQLEYNIVTPFYSTLGTGAKIGTISGAQ